MNLTLSPITRPFSSKSIHVSVLDSSSRMIPLVVKARASLHFFIYLVCVSLTGKQKIMLLQRRSKRIYIYIYILSDI